MQALVLEQSDGLTHAQIREIDAEQLPAGDVTVDISWSSINYKDALAITGKGKIIRNFPMVPGIDFVGTVGHSDSDRFTVGQPVILTGWGVGENHWGGLAQQARVKSDWLVPLPASLDARNAMILGTAGFTAMLCVMALEDGGVTPESGDIIVTGASGGVGSTAVALLAELGYQVTAVSGRADNTDYLKNWAPNRCWIAVNSVERLAHWKNNAGLAQLIPSATTCWQRCWHRWTTTQQLLHVVWLAVLRCQRP